MKLARAIHFDNTDAHTFAQAAHTGEWCLSGDFEFRGPRPAPSDHAARSAFSGGWLGLESGGRVSVVAVSWIDSAEIARLVERLAETFVTHLGVETVDAARPLAADEMVKMADVCAAHPTDSLLTIARQMTENGLEEAVHVVQRDDILGGRAARRAMLVTSA